jgi:tRNA-dihydrouridine synthase A
VLKGLSPRDNRAVPRLRYEEVYRLKREFPLITIVINGGIQSQAEIAGHLAQVDGVMLGRAAYHDPYCLAQADAGLWGGLPAARAAVAEAMHRYASRETAAGTPLRAIARHLLGLFHGQPRARLWRQMLSDAAALAANEPGLILRALEATEPAHAAA